MYDTIKKTQLNHGSMLFYRNNQKEERERMGKKPCRESCSASLIEVKIPDEFADDQSP
jgi:hypothetical protein